MTSVGLGITAHFSQLCGLPGSNELSRRWECRRTYERTVRGERMLREMESVTRKLKGIIQGGVSPTKIRKVPQKCVLDRCVQDRFLVSLFDRLE
jgi:hypothetical protein